METKKLGKYEIVSKIGEGAMGEVYKAYDPVLGREVAVKTMSAAIGADNELRQRFHREAQSAARLNHPNIITVYDFGEDQGRAYIAMELLEGDDLSELIARQAPMSLEEKIAVMEQMAEGLAFAHARDVVHRDLKPGNIHVQHGGHVKIMDFGLARLSTSNMTRAGMVMGTPNYMSPEQVRGERATARSDVFSLGSVFYELLAYRKPFDADSLHAVLYQVMQSEPPPIAEAVPGLPLPVREVVERSMAKDAGRRYQDAGELRDALRAMRGSPPGSRPGSFPPAAGPRPGVSLPASPVPTARSPVTAGAGPGTAVAVVQEESLPSQAPAATVAHDAATLAHQPVTVAQAPTLAPESPTLPVGPPTQIAPKTPTRRSMPAVEPVPPPAPPVRRAPSRLPIVGGVALFVVAAGYLAVRSIQGTPPAGPIATATPQAPAPPPAEPSVQVEESALSIPDVGPALAEARRSLEARDYRTAAARAEAVLAQERGNIEGDRVLRAAREAVRKGDTAARELKAALDAGDPDQASAGLKRLVTLDPHHPEMAALTLRVGDVVRLRAADAQRALDQARRQPSPTLAPTSAPVQHSVAPPTTLPAPTPPPVTAPPVTLPAAGPPASMSPAQMETARKAIRGVLEEYRSAVETRNADYLRRVAPGVDHEALRSAFAAVASMEVKIEVKEVNVSQSGETATAICLVTYTPKPKPAGRISPLPTTFRLRRSGNVWIIEDVARK